MKVIMKLRAGSVWDSLSSVNTIISSAVSCGCETWSVTQIEGALEQREEYLDTEKEVPYLQTQRCTQIFTEYFMNMLNLQAIRWIMTLGRIFQENYQLAIFLECSVTNNIIVIMQIKLGQLLDSDHLHEV
jgi:hypothetical protein